MLPGIFVCRQRDNAVDFMREAPACAGASLVVTKCVLRYFGMFVYFVCLIAACAAATRAMGTRNGEQLT